MIKVGIIGATGYAGEELVRLLLNHKQVKIEFLCSKTFADKNFYEVYKNFFDIIDEKCLEDNIPELSKKVDVIFTATPQGYLSSLIDKNILDNCKIIDLSADYRFKNIDTYESWYKLKHNSKELTKEAVYGLSEIYRDKIKNVRLLSNPGCYTTCAILSIYPLLKENIIDDNSIIVDAKSGTSGAGRSEKIANSFCEVNENIKAYSIATHRHTVEIEEQLSLLTNKNIIINFTPHLIPMNRGILETIYANLSNDKKYTYEDIKNIYNKYYKNEKFIRLLDEDMYPETKYVKNSNYLDINFKIDERTNRIIVVSALDNLFKGAAGQAIQNMNIMFNFREDEGIDFVPCCL